MTAAIFRAIADSSRRSILDLLRTGERAVVDLLEHFDFSQPALSKHLKVFRDAKPVRARKGGRESRCVRGHASELQATSGPTWDLVRPRPRVRAPLSRRYRPSVSTTPLVTM